MLTAIENGEGVLVQFIEINKEEDEAEEEEQKSDYSEDAFDEEEKPVTPRIMRVPIEKVQKGFKDIKMKLMIKKVPYTHMAKYLLDKVDLVTDEETGLANLSTSQLASILETKFKMSESKSKKIARFIVEGPSTSEEDAEIEEKDHKVDTEIFITRLREHIPKYFIFNGLAITSKLTQIQNIVDTGASKLAEDLIDDDYDGNGFIPME